MDAVVLYTPARPELLEPSINTDENRYDMRFRRVGCGSARCATCAGALGRVRARGCPATGRSVSEQFARVAQGGGCKDDIQHHGVLQDT